MSSALQHETGGSFAHSRGVRCPELLRLHESGSVQHLVQFYEDESFVIRNVSYLVAKTLAAGDSSIILATECHLKQIGERLAYSGVNLDAFRESGRYLEVDAIEALSQVIVDDRPDKEKFDDVIGRVVRRSTEKSANGFVFVFGEMVALLCATNNADGAVHLERLWNSLAERQRFSLYCAYPLNSLSSEPDADALIQICAEHVLTIPAETSL
jgi:MEDS: MEthanogen/methylotroph, DcmR Sensory domain